jgi:hypothetical protein
VCLSQARERLGGVLRLAAITCEALPRFETAALSGFGLFFGVSLRRRHAAPFRFAWVFGGCSMGQRM